MSATQPTLPGLTPRGRPPSGIPLAERNRRYQAERRKSSELQSLSTEVERVLLVAFKTEATNRRVTMRDALAEAMRNWIELTPAPEAK